MENKNNDNIKIKRKGMSIPKEKRPSTRRGRGRAKGETYTKNKPLYNLYIMADNKNKISFGSFSSYEKIGEFLKLKRSTVQNIALKRIKNKYNNITIEKIDST